MWYDQDPDNLPRYDVNVAETEIPFNRVPVDPGNAELICEVRESYPDFNSERIVGHLEHALGVTVTYDEVRSVLTPE